MYYGQHCGYNPCYPSYSYPVAPVAGVGYYGCHNWFALIVVLFILLIIIGASCYC